MLPILYNGSSHPAALTTAGTTNRLASLFDTFFNDGFADAGLPMGWWQDEDFVYLEVDAPGLTEQDVELSYEQGALTIRGERKCERKGSRYDSRSYGRFEQQFTLPADVDPDGIEARLTNGVLRVQLRKSAASKPRKIALKSE